MFKDRLQIRIKSIASLSTSEKANIATFISMNSCMNLKYAYNEFLSHFDREVLFVYNEAKEIKMVLSVKHIEGKTNFIYWGDLIKETSFRGVSLTYLFFKYLWYKEGLFSLFLKRKYFLTFCFNPRVYALLPKYLNVHSIYDQNTQHRIFSTCLKQFGYEDQVFDGFFIDKSIDSKVPLSDLKRYSSKHPKLNKFFHNHIFQSDGQGGVFYNGKSMAIVAYYCRKQILPGLYLFASSLISQIGSWFLGSERQNHQPNIDFDTIKI